jgi:hypothetical protein
MLNETFITVFFRLVNFVALIGLVIFAFKKYFRASVQEAIENKKLKEINIGNHIRELEHRSKNLSDDIVHQEQLCEYLIDRTTRWQQVFEEHAKQRLQEQKNLALQVRIKAEQQVENLAKERALRAVLPMAIEQTTARLKELYANPAHNERFVNGIVEFMQKSS